MPLSRPKVHRLPVAARHTSRKSQNMLVSVAAILTFVVMGVSYSKFSDKQAAELPDIMPVTANLNPLKAPEKENDTIVIKDDNQTIVGQMAKIPSRNQQITEIKSVSNVDKGTGRELLSIIGKY